MMMPLPTTKLAIALLSDQPDNRGDTAPSQLSHGVTDPVRGGTLPKGRKLGLVLMHTCSCTGDRRQGTDTDSNIRACSRCQRCQTTFVWKKNLDEMVKAKCTLLTLWRPFPLVTV
jgi:hypothetical protein